MHFGTKQTLNSKHSGEIENDRKMIRHSHRARTMIKDRARAVGAFLLSAALVIGLMPIVAPDEVMPETQAAQVAQVSFENKSKAEVEEMMKHMTIDEIVDAMPLRDKVSQMFITYTDDLNNATNGGSGLQAVNTTVKNNLATYPVGGVCYFRTNLTGGQAKSKKMSDDFQANNKYGMLIAVDEEGGAVQRIGGSNTQKYTTAGHSNPPGALTAFYRQWEAIPGVGVGTELLHMYAYENQGTGTAYSNAQSLAENCKLIGANWDFAPVVDVDLKAGNAIAQAGRTYSKDVDLAADLTTSAVKGFNDSGIVCSAKHFPGHGSVAGDTHNGFVDQTKTLSELEATDLKVYKEILSDPDAELDSIMFGHMSTSNVEGASNIPASVSKYWVDYIRNKLNFDGVVLTDGMRMDALKNFFGGTDDGYIQATVAAFDAGIDMFLLSGLPLTGIPTLESHITSDTTGAAMENLNDSVRRIMTLKRKYNIIPAYENDAEATYISSDGAMEHGTFAAMWSKASTEALQSGKPAPVVRLNKNVTANSNGSFGTGTNIAANGDLTLTANHSVTVDLNGFTLNKNLSGSSSAGGKHIFNIPANATVTIHDSSSAQNGKITGAGGGVGTVAYATGASAKFIVDSGNITGNTGTSLIYGDSNAVMRFGIQDVAGNNAGPINITNNTAEYAVDFSGTMYLMGETVIKDNGGANLYFNGENSIINVQDRGLTGGKESIGVTVSATRAANVDLIKPAGGITLSGNDLNALFYDDGTYQLELDTNIKLIKVDGDVRFVSSDGSTNDTGTWDEMWNLSQTKDGTLTVLKDLNISYTTASAADNKYVNKKNTTIQLNGKKLVVSANNGRFINNESGTLTIADRGTSNKREEKVSQVANDASFDRVSYSLTYYEDRLSGSTLETYKVVEDLSAVGMISFATTNKYAGNPEADGIIQNASGTVNITGGVLTSEHSRGITAKTNTTVNMSGGYIAGCNSWGHASALWSFGANATVNISGGVIADNHSYGTSGSSGALGIYSGTAKAIITGGLFTGNTAVKNGAAIGMANNGTTTSLSVSNATICHNESPNGAGIYAHSASAVNIVDSLISSNTSSTYGGGIYMNGSTAVNLSGNTAVMNNKAATSAGGIYNATSGKLSIKDNIVVKNNIANGVKSDIAVITNGNKVSVNGTITSPSRSIGVDLPNAAPGNVFATGNGYTVQASDAGKFFIDSDETLFGSLDGNNNIHLEQGEAQYVSPDGVMENGNLKALWTKYFTAGTSGTITLMKDVTLSDDSQLVLETKASQATLDLNGKNLVLANNRTDNESPIYIPSGSFEICDSSATASTAKTVVDVPAGTRAILSDDLNKLTYYTTEHEQDGIVTYKNDADLSAIGHIRYTGGSDPSGIVHVGTSGTFTLTNGLLNCTNGRAILNGMPTGTCTSKVNINGGYIAGCKAGLASVLLARNGSTTNINGGVIAGNMNPTGRGTVWMNSVSVNTLNMTGGIISGNYAKGGSNAEQGGGAILVEYSNTSATITGGMITHNSTDANGGGICYATAAPANGLSISNVVISANKSSKNGGGIYSGRNINDPNCHIDANEASGRGGAIYTTAGLIANSLCTSENVAGQSAGIYAANSITMKGKISIEDNVSSGGIVSNLDIKHLPADKVQIVDALESGSKIGLSIAKSSTERNQKVVSSTIGLNDSYSDMFYDDADEDHVLRFNDGEDGLYLIQEDIDGDELGTQEAPKFEEIGGGVIHRQAANMSWSGNGANQNMQHLLVGTGKALTSNFGAWSRYIFTFDSETQKYKCTQVVPTDTTNWPNTAITLGTDQVMFCSYPATSGLDPNFSVGDYVDFDFVPTTTEKSSTSGIGNYTVYSYNSGPEIVTYKIHYIYHYPVSEVMTGEYYVEDQTRMVEKTGEVGQIAYVPFGDMAGYLESDSHNFISTTLQASGTKSGSDWYYQDETFQGMYGSADSVNDLYVIYEHSEEEYTYNVEYYDADSGKLIKVDENLTADALPIQATTSMKTLHEYEYDANNVNNVDTIESSSSSMVLKLYFKKWPTYTVEYYDADTMEKLDESIMPTYTSKPVQSGTAVSMTDLPDALKSIDGYDYVVKQGATVESIASVSQDGTSKMKLYFEKIIHRPYTIEYYDKDTGNLVGTLEKGDVKAGTKVTLPAINEEYAIASENVKYRIVPDDSRNVTEITIPRSGDVPAMKVYGEKVNTTRVHIQRYEYDGSKWATMGLPVIIDCDSNTEFNVLTAENKTKYVDGISGYIFLPNDPKNVTQVHVGGITDPTPVVKLHYAKVSGTNAVQKTPNDNGLVPIERASTKDFIKIELFDYGRSINDRATSTGSYPIFKGYPISGTASNAWQLGNIGETVQYDAATATAGDKLGYNKTTSGLINRLTASSVDNNRAQGANAAVNGFTYDYVGGRKTTPGKNPMSNVLGADGLPVLADGTSLSYLFTDSNDVSATDPNDFTVKKIASGIDGLFDYNPDTGYYSYSSSKNHAEYNAETNKFDVYDQIITPNLSDYSFGNFLPFTKINDKATKSVKVNQEYIQQVAKYARYKYNNETDTDLKNRYKSVADSLESIDKLMVNQYGIGYDYNDVLNVYYRGQNGNVVPNNVTNPQDCFTNPITGEKYFESFEDFYNKLYMIDYDEVKNFFFGITFELDFVQPQEGQIGSDRRNMVFDFEGDDDVLIYIDGKLFLNLAGIHRQVGGQIDFTQGIIKYEDFNYNAGVTMQASYPTQAGYSRLDEGIVTFREALTAAGMSQSEIDSMLNEQGTFKDWTSHNFKMFYMERGSGSGVMRLNFNLPLIPNNSVLVAKNITNENEEYQPILSDPFFNMQFVKCDDDGQPITYATGEKKGKAVPYLEEGTPYMIYENGAYTGRTRYVDENGMVSLRANQFAVITDVAKPGDKYLVRELIPKEFAEQFDKTVVTNNSVFGVGDYQQPDVTHEVSSDPENGEWYPNEDGVMTNYMVRASYPMAPDGVNLSSTLFENNLNSMMLGAVAISKDIIEGDHTWSDNDEFNIAVAFDGKPLSATTSANTPSTYYVYTKDENGQFEIQGDGETRRVPADGIITIKANEVAVLRYMLAGSTFEAYEIDNSGTGNYHPIYMRDPETGENVYSGKVTVGSKDDPVRFNITNQRADNLEISKVVENMPADGTDMDYTFEVSIAADDRHIDDTYEYEVFAIDDEIDSTTMRELADRDTAVSLYQEYLATGASLDMGQVKPNRSTVTFKDGKASLSLKANQKVIIYGLPYQCNYTVTETSASGEYQAFYKGTNMNEFTNGTVATFVLDSKSTDTGSATTVEFKNRKIEDLSVSKKVEIGVIDSLLGKYESDFQTKFKFSISDASYQGEPLSGDYEADIVDSYNKTDGQDTVTSTTVTFDNGQALFELSHGQTLTVRGLPYGALYTVSEEENPAYDTSYKIGTDNILEQAFEGTSTPQQSIASNNHVYFSNSLIMSGLPTTGGIGLIVIAVALIGGMIFLGANMRRRRLFSSNVPDSEGTSGDTAV